MMKSNIELRELMKANRVPVWAIAQELGVHENTVLRRLRTELPEQVRRQYTDIVNRLAAENES